MKKRPGTVKKPSGALIGVWMPDRLVKTIDQAAALLQQDRAKFLRRAIQEKLARRKK